MFSLVNPYGVEPVKLPALEKSLGEMGYTAIFSQPFLGPSFGTGGPWNDFQSYDLTITNKANECSSSSSYLGKSFRCPEGKPRDLFLTGTAKFFVTDYEVFELYEW